MTQKALRKTFKRLPAFFVALGLLLSTALQAQISGTVVDDANDEPLIGASILVAGTSTGTITDIDGNFTIEANSGDVLEVSYTGYTTQNVTLGAETTIQVRLSQGVLFDEVVVTGYAVESKRQTTGAVSTIPTQELTAIPSGNVEQQLQGRVSGVTVLTNGQPGTTSQIRVRGFGAFEGNQPLYVVDGVPVGSTDFLNPDDIESTTVLKDAAAASIYGARAAAGVIVYTTKQGARKKQRMQVSYNGMIGFTDPNVNGSPQMLNPQEMAEWTHIAYENNAAANGTDPQYTHPQYGTNAVPTLPDYLHANGQNGVVGTVDEAAIRAAYEADPENVFLIKPNLEGTNWYDEITRTAPIHRHSLGFSGGTENGRYYVGLGAQHQKGILIANEYSRYTFRINSEWDLLDWLSIGENIQGTYRSVVGQQGGQGGIGIADDESEVLSAYRMPTIIPVYDEFGSFASTKAAGFNNGRNPVRRLTLNNGSDRNFNANGFGNLYIKVTPFKDLTLRSSIGGQYDNFYGVNYGFRYLGDSEPEASNSFSEFGGYVFRWVFTNTATYKGQFGDHGITALAGVESLNTGAGRNMNGSGINPFSTDLDFISLSNVQSPVVNSSLFSGVNFYSIFGKLDYNLKEKYYVTGVIRRDGSSRFGENNRYGVFPAFSAAWRVTAESFMEGVTWLDDLKIRGGWGEMGNSNNVDPFNQFSLYRADRGNTFYPINGQNSGVDEGFAQSRIGNPDAKWETSETLNIGFDASMFNNRLEIIFDWWKKDTRDLLFQVPLPGVTGNYAAAPAVNVGGMLNQGLDLQLVGRGNVTSDLTWELTLNGSILKNEITGLTDDLDILTTVNPGFRGINPIRNEVGQPLSSFFGYNVIGYFSSQADVDSHAEQPGAGIGRFKYEDIDGDGVITPDDRTFLGDPIPDFTGGATLVVGYKNFTLDMYLYTSIGNEIWNQTKWFTDFFGTFEGSAKGVRALESWTPELGDNAAAPIWESASNLSTSGAANSWYVEDGTFLRLQRIGLSYTFSDDILKGSGLTNVTLGASANNLWTLTAYEGLDPMVGGGADTNFGIDVGNYPVTPSFLFNLSLGF
jgi:TonB-linked SusC/RagA family outer membrane protein